MPHTAYSSHTSTLQVLEWLDPSIPLMFLLSGSDASAPSAASAGDQGPSLAGFSVIGVPRLTVLAANALHGSLLADIARAEVETVAQEQRWKEEDRLREERKKQREAGLKLSSKLANQIGAIFNRSPGK